ncbi:MAG: prolipoprotein diacylglyceryl transferase [Candidatus Omnitrophota bacterium]
MNGWLEAWQHLPSKIDPVLFRWGGFEIRYYGLCFFLSILTVYLLSIRRQARESCAFTRLQIENYFVWVVLGVLLGGRVGYVLFYDLEYFLREPWAIFLPFSAEGGLRYTGISGMSFHGGLCGAFLATWLYSWRQKIPAMRFVDFITASVPFGYLFGRLGNFLNGELYGRSTGVPWGMFFPSDPEGLLRHPSQLYEALGEGVLLFLLLWPLRRRIPFDGFLFGLYLIGYGAVRFGIEFFREPDVQVGLFFGWMSMGQILCLAMIAAGILVWVIFGGVLRKPSSRER